MGKRSEVVVSVGWKAPSVLDLPLNLRRAAATFALATTLGLTVTTATAAATESTDPAVSAWTAVPVSAPLGVVSTQLQDLCGQAEQLTDDGRPDEALEFIDRVRKPGTSISTRITRELADACEQERQNALAAAGQAALNERPTAEPADPPSQDVCDVAGRLVDADQPDRALSLIDKLREPAEIAPPRLAALGEACEDERLRALTAAAAAELEAGTPAQAAGRSWADSVGAWFDPLRGPALAYIGVLLGLLVLARLLVVLPDSPWRVRTEGGRRMLLLLGLVLVVLAPAGIVAGVLGLSTATDAASAASLPAAPSAGGDAAGGAVSATVGTVVAVVGLIVGLALGILGSVLLSVSLAARLSLSVTVRDAEGRRSEAQTAEAIAILSELGASPPRGLEVPSGTDVSVLAEGALPAPAGNKVAAVLRPVLQVLFGTTPWRITVDPVGSDRAAVVITRNGHPITAVTVDPARWDVPAAEAGRYRIKIVAAVILATLAPRHAGFEALCGAKDWRSIGLHSLATTDFKRDNVQSARLLALALDHDPENLPALVALKHVLHREQRDPGQLRRYGEWLTAQSDAIADGHPFPKASGDQDGYIDLHRRILLTYFVTVLNYRAIRGSYSSWPNDAEVATLADRLIELLADGTSPSGGLRDAMRLQAATLLDGVYANADSELVPPDWRERALGSLAPATAYNVACGYVRNGDDLRNPEVREKFERAFTLDHLRAWAQKDPELTSLHTDDVFRDLVGLTPRTDYWQLDAFSQHRDKLAAAGIVNPARLLSRAADDDLRRYLALPVPVFTHLTRVAQLVQRAQDVSWAHGGNPVGRIQVEVIAELLARGVEVPGDIHPAWVSTRGSIDRTVARDIATAIQARTWRSVDVPNLVAWLRFVRETPEGDTHSPV
jgi:hypothetical protein